MKNKFMRLASVMLVLTLLTTCGVSGTYAKYVTTASSSDSARVAKFGVEIIANNDASLFKTTYKKDDTTKQTTFTNTVESTDKVVAPGTDNSGSTYFAITGTPEVAVEISYSIQDNYTQPRVPTGTYTNWTGEDDATFTVGTEYTPVKFTLKQGNTPLLEKGTLEDLQTILAQKKIFCKAGTDLASLGTQAFTLSWEWAFEDTSVADVNKLDTLLGQKAAGVEKSANIVTDLAFDLAITVTQID